MRPFLLARASRALLVLAALSSFGTLAAAQCPAPDAFEPNDTCATAAFLSDGVHAATLVANETDHYRVTVPAFGRVDFEVNTPNTKVSLWSDAACSVPHEAWGPWSEAIWIRHAYNNSAVAVDLYLTVEHYGFPAVCKNYWVEVDFDHPTNCVDPAREDAYAPNQDYASAAAIAPGFHQLFMNWFTPDYYRITVPAGESVDVLLDAWGLYVTVLLFDDSAGGTLIDSSINDTGALFHWLNTTSQSVDLVLSCEMYYGGDCVSYRLTVDRSDLVQTVCAGDGVTGIGAGPVPCPCGNTGALGHGCANSASAQGAALSAVGPPGFDNANFAFTCTGGVPGQPAILLQGTAVTALPFKDGVLCVGGSTERMQIGAIDGSGTWSSVGDEAAQGNVSTPGSVRFYQLWFRDPQPNSPCGQGSTFSSGLRVIWH